MCGIVGYIGKRNIASDYVLEGLQALEYRGYDSAGVTMFDDGKPLTIKQVGRVEGLEKQANQHGSKKSHLEIGRAHV